MPSVPALQIKPAPNSLEYPERAIPPIMMLPRWLLTGIMPIAFAMLALRLVQAARRILWPRAATGASQ